MSDDQHGPRPSVRPTAPSTIAVSALIGLAATLLIVARYYQHVPELAWYNSVAIVALAVLLAWMAWTTHRTLNADMRDRRASVAERSEADADRASALEGPGHAMQIARYAMLGKAAAIAGALFFGAYLGFTVWLTVQRDRLQAASEDLPGAVIGTIACMLLVLTARLLEHSCRIPPSREDDDHTPK